MKYKFHDIDERIIKTRIALSGAIFEIIKKSEKVKVLDICKEADVTPMTYYHHFHNKYQLLEFSVKSQLENILPIPRKLKPNNMKQLIAYLIKTIIIFLRSNRDLIKSSYDKILINGWQNSYLDVLIKMIRYLIYDEILLLYPNINKTKLDILSDMITYSLLWMIINRLLKEETTEFYWVWNTLKELWKEL